MLCCKNARVQLNIFNFPHIRKQRKKSMTTIDYSGISTDDFGILNSEEFRYLLEKNPNLRLVEVTYGDEGDEIFTHVAPPFHREPENCIGVIDRTDGEKFMWILYDGFVSVEDPSASLIATLVIMDEFVTLTQEARLFVPINTALYLDDAVVLAADYDFSAGDYLFTVWYS